MVEQESFEEKFAKIVAAQTALAPPQVQTQNLNGYSTNGHTEEEVIGLQEVPTEKFADTPRGQSLIQATSKENFTCEMAWKMYMDPAGIPGKPDPRGEINLLCPWHKEKKPSFSINIKENAWFCRNPKCLANKGGDALAIAALKLGYDLGTYKQSLPAIREEVAKALGWREEPRYPGLVGKPALIPPDQVPTEDENENENENNKPPVISITEAPSFVDESENHVQDEDADVVWPSISNLHEKAKTPTPSFVTEYLKATCPLAWPDEYNLWYAWQLLGAAVGKALWLPGSPKNVFPNLFLCVTGPSGGGKSQSADPALEIYEEVCSYITDPGNRGVKMIRTPNSHVFLIQEFSNTFEDPFTKQKVNYPVNGLLRYSEASTLLSLGKDNRKYEDIIKALYDNEKKINTGAKLGGVTEALHPFASLITTTQLKTVKRQLTLELAETGYLNRFSFPMGPPVRRGWDSDRQSYDLSAAVRELQEVKAFYSIPGNAGEIDYTPEGLEHAKHLWTTKGEPLKDNDGSGLLGRLDLHMKKFVLIHAINRKITGRNITPEIVDQAWSYFPYIVETSRMIGARVGITVEGDKENKVLAALKNWQTRNPKNDAIDVTRLSKNLTGKVNLGDLTRILDYLIRLGVVDLIEPVRQPGQRGRLGKKYRYAG